MENRFKGFNIGLAGCGIKLKIEAGRGIMKIFVTGCEMKLEQLDRDKLHFQGGIRDKTGDFECVIEPKNTRRNNFTFV